MRITPLEIRQKTFERNLRGYDKDEVNAFLATLSQEWERTLDELKESKMRLENSEREVTKLREVETSLYKTLKTAEDTGANLVEQATRTAELQIKEAQLNAEAMLYEARTKAREITEEAEKRAQQTLYDIDQRIRELVQQYRGLVNYRDGLSTDLGRIAQELADRAERLKKVNEGFNPELFLSQARKDLEAVVVPERSAPVPPPASSAEISPMAETPKPVTEPKGSATGSFFDQIG